MSIPLYKDFRPTGVDRHIYVSELEDWHVAGFRSRDSSILENCNFAEALEMLGGESPNVQVHRFGHWGCGWFELILADPSKVAKVTEILASLESYPVLNESRYSQAIHEAVSGQWSNAPICERIRLCHEAEVSIFQARSESPCEEVFSRMSDRII